MRILILLFTLTSFGSNGDDLVGLLKNVYDAKKMSRDQAKQIALGFVNWNQRLENKNHLKWFSEHIETNQPLTHQVVDLIVGTLKFDIKSADSYLAAHTISELILNDKFLVEIFAHSENRYVSPSTSGKEWVDKDYERAALKWTEVRRALQRLDAKFNIHKNQSLIEDITKYAYGEDYKLLTQKFFSIEGQYIHSSFVTRFNSGYKISRSHYDNIEREILSSLSYEKLYGILGAERIKKALLRQVKDLSPFSLETKGVENKRIFVAEKFLSDFDGFLSFSENKSFGKDLRIKLLVKLINHSYKRSSISDQKSDYALGDYFLSILGKWNETGKLFSQILEAYNEFRAHNLERKEISKNFTIFIESLIYHVYSMKGENFFKENFVIQELFFDFRQTFMKTQKTSVESFHRLFNDRFNSSGENHEEIMEEGFFNLLLEREDYFGKENPTMLEVLGRLECQSSLTMKRK